MKNKIYVVLLLAILLGAIAHSAPVLIDFSTVDQYYFPGQYDENIARIGDAHFSNSLYTHPDGFKLYNGYAYNWYGEKREFITFDNPVSLTQIDVAQVSGFSVPLPSSMIMEMYDSAGNLLKTVTTPVSSTFQTVSLSQTNVKKLLFDFTGGGEAYSDGRTHGWYFIDNLRYDNAIPEPTSGILFFFSILFLCFFCHK